MVRRRKADTEKDDEERASNFHSLSHPSAKSKCLSHVTFKPSAAVVAGGFVS